MMQVVLEGNLVNLDVTSPGATLALGLMFLKTHDTAMAAAFAIPATRFDLDYVRLHCLLMIHLSLGQHLTAYSTPSSIFAEEHLLGHTLQRPVRKTRARHCFAVSRPSLARVDCIMLCIPAQTMDRTIMKTTCS